jgi:hypothetical protein
MKKLAKKLIAPIYHLFVERCAFDKSVPLINRIIYSFRYRLAGKGILINENEKKLAALKNKHAGQRCFIIGNGPSLNNIDLTLMKDEITFGVNAIYLNYEKMQFYPTYYAVEDPLVAADRKDEINAYHESEHKFFGAYFSELFKQDDKTIWMNVIRNFDDEFDPKREFPKFSTDCLRRIYVTGTVTYLCLQLAYYMGFKEVYMVGFDHNYVIPDSALISNVRQSGFVIESTEDDPNHFNPQYFGKGYKWHDPRVDRMEMGYRKAKQYFEADGRKIINATHGGKLEVFERLKYEDLFDNKSKA